MIRERILRDKRLEELLKLHAEKILKTDTIGLLEIFDTAPN
jgi:hypothetical protein